MDGQKRIKARPQLLKLRKVFRPRSRPRPRLFVFNYIYKGNFVAASAALCALMFLCCAGSAADNSFNILLNKAVASESRGDIPAALRIYDHARLMQLNNAANLCLLSRRCCDITYLTNSVAIEKDALKRALDCALAAERADSNSAAAHASAAVCYARSCAFADIKTQLAYSRLFKQEAEKTIALDPRQDIAYYLLGRWNYEIARVGFFSRAYVKVVYGGLPKASYQDAITNFQKAISLAPDRIIHHAGLAMAYEAAGEKEQALTELEKCRKLKPTDLADQESQRDAIKRLPRSP